MVNAVKAPPGSNPGAQVLLFMALAVATISQSLIFSVLPPVGRLIRLTDLQISSITTISALCFVLASPLLGSASERWGRLPLIRFGLVTGVIFNVLFALTIEAQLNGSIGSDLGYCLLILWRVCMSISWAGMFPATQAYVADTTSPEHRTAAITILTAGFGVGMIAAPAIAWLWSNHGAVAPFYFTAGASGIALILVWKYLPAIETQAQAARSDATDTRMWPIAPYLVVALITSLVSTLLQQLAGFRLQDTFELDHIRATEWTGAALAGMGVATLFSRFTVLWLSMRRGVQLQPYHLLLFGSGIAIIGMTGLSIGDAGLSVMACSTTVFGLGLGLLGPGAAAGVTLSAGRSSQGRAAGLLSSSQGVGYVIGPVLGTGLYHLNQSSPFWVSVSLLCVVLVFAISAGLRQRIIAQAKTDPIAP
jgi:MFS family permease